MRKVFIALSLGLLLCGCREEVSRQLISTKNDVMSSTTCHKMGMCHGCVTDYASKNGNMRCGIMLRTDCPGTQATVVDISTYNITYDDGTTAIRDIEYTKQLVGGCN